MGINLVQPDQNRQKSKSERPKENCSRNVGLRSDGWLGAQRQSGTEGPELAGVEGRLCELSVFAGQSKGAQYRRTNRPKSTPALARTHGLGRNWKLQAGGRGGRARRKVNLNTYVQGPEGTQRYRGSKRF